ncbi:MAG: substrate-binding domain-containing protein, partial [Oscillospiraceae bacterium]
MKKLASLTLAAALSLSLLAGCAPKTPAADPDVTGDSSATPTVDAALTGTVSTNGSTSMEKVIGVLMEQFMAENTGVSVTYDPTGSGSGITAVSEGRADIGLSSRALKDEEAATMTGKTLALDGIAIIVNNENTVKELTLDQITKIFTGEIANWKDVGGADGPIVLIGREGGSGTRDGFES